MYRFGVIGKPLSAAEQVGVQARQLLARHGVVTHASLDDEFGAWDWGLIYPELQRLELRGEVRRGYFVQGLAGIQFALPAAVEQLRELASAGPRADPATDAEALVVLNACDPANCYGPASDHAPQTAAGVPLTFARLPSTWVVLNRGLPLLLAEDSGARLTTMAGAEPGLLPRAIDAWLKHMATFIQRVQVVEWDGAPVLRSSRQGLLEAAGFVRDYPGMSWQ